MFICLFERGDTFQILSQNTTNASVCIDDVYSIVLVIYRYIFMFMYGCSAYCEISPWWPNKIIFTALMWTISVFFFSNVQWRVELKLCSSELELSWISADLVPNESRVELAFLVAVKNWFESSCVVFYCWKESRWIESKLLFTETKWIKNPKIGESYKSDVVIQMPFVAEFEY